MIDFETGKIDIGGTIITPITKFEDFEKMENKNFKINKVGEGCGIITFFDYPCSNGITAKIKYFIDEKSKMRNIVIKPFLNKEDNMTLLQASKQWLKGFKELKYEEDDTSISGGYNWGHFCAMVKPDRFDGVTGGEINVYYE